MAFRIRTGVARRARLMALAVVVAGFAVPVGTGGVAAAGTSVNIAYIGDTPYKSSEQVKLPGLVNDINNDSAVQFTAHAGDTKGGSDLCSDANMTTTLNGYKGLSHPFWYTIGDNEWTDCHRDSNGGYDPLERLGWVRANYFPNPGQTTPVGPGGNAVLSVHHQDDPADATHKYVENTWFQQDCVTFGTIHEVTSANGHLPPNDPFYLSYNPANVSTIFPATSPSISPAWPVASTQAQRDAEADARTAADIAWIDQIFNNAIANHSEGVFFMMQAEPALLADQPNTVLPGQTNSSLPQFTQPQNVTGNDIVSFRDEYAGIRAELLLKVAQFGKPVILAHGDQHTYTITKNYGGLPNLTRLENVGSSNLGGAVSHWSQVQADCGVNSATVFSTRFHTWTGTNASPIDSVDGPYVPMFDANPGTNVPEGRLALGLAVGGVIAMAWILVSRRRTAHL